MARGREDEPRDFGPEIRLKEPTKKTLRKQPSTAARRRIAASVVVIEPLRVTVKEYRPDPANVGCLVRGARVRDPLRKMYEARYITKRQWDGAEAFRDDAALAAGARLNQLDDAGVRSPLTNRNWPSESQVAALKRVNRTMAHFDEIERALVTWSLLEHRPLTEFTKDRVMRNEEGGPLLRSVLDYIAQHHRAVEAVGR